VIGCFSFVSIKWEVFIWSNVRLQRFWAHELCMYIKCEARRSDLLTWQTLINRHTGRAEKSKISRIFISKNVFSSVNFLSIHVFIVVSGKKMRIIYLKKVDLFPPPRWLLYQKYFVLVWVQFCKKNMFETSANICSVIEKPLWQTKIIPIKVAVYK
jgi:hypothetical protein